MGFNSGFKGLIPKRQQAFWTCWYRPKRTWGKGRGGALCVIISKNHGTNFWRLQILWYLSPWHHKSPTCYGGRSDALPIWIMKIPTVGRINKHLT